MKTILIATDFSAPATNALNYGVELANLIKAHIVLLNVSSLPLSGYGTTNSLEVLGQIENASGEMLRTIKLSIQQKYTHLNVVTELALGSTVAAIKDVVIKHKVDYLVMGIVGQAGIIKEHIIGSTTLSAAREIQLPLFIVPEGVTYKTIEKISFACDVKGIEGSPLVKVVHDFCNMFGARLEIVSIEHTDNEIEPPKVQPYELIEGGFGDLKHETIVLSDDKTALKLVDYFSNHATGLIMINPKRYSLLKSIFHTSITKHLAFHINIPLLVIH